MDSPQSNDRRRRFKYFRRSIANGCERLRLFLKFEESLEKKGWVLRSLANRHRQSHGRSIVLGWSVSQSVTRSSPINWTVFYEKYCKLLVALLYNQIFSFGIRIINDLSDSPDQQFLDMCKSEHRPRDTEYGLKCSYQ